MAKLLFVFVILLGITRTLFTQGIGDQSDNSAPNRYTITHEATFDIVIKENAHADEVLAEGRIIIGLFGDIVPMTVLNFVTITNGIVRSNVRDRLNEVTEL